MENLNSKTIGELLQIDGPGLMIHTFGRYISACNFHSVPENRRLTGKQWAEFGTEKNGIFDRYKSFTLLHWLTAFEKGMRDPDGPIETSYPNISMRIVSDQLKKFIHTIPAPEAPKLQAANPTAEQNERKAEEAKARKIMNEGTPEEKLRHMLPGLKAAAKMDYLFQFSGPVWTPEINTELFKMVKEQQGEEWFKQMGNEIAAAWYENARQEFKRNMEWLRSFGSIPACRVELQKEFPGAKHTPKFSRLPAAEAQIRMECVRKIKMKGPMVPQD